MQNYYFGIIYENKSGKVFEKISVRSEILQTVVKNRENGERPNRGSNLELHFIARKLNEAIFHDNKQRPCP